MPVHRLGCFWARGETEHGGLLRAEQSYSPHGGWKAEREEQEARDKINPSRAGLPLPLPPPRPQLLTFLLLLILHP